MDLFGKKKIADLRNQLDHANTKINNLEITRAELKGKLISMEEENNSLIKQALELKSQLNKLTSREEYVQGRLTEAIQNEAQSKRRISALKGTITRMKS